MSQTGVDEDGDYIVDVEEDFEFEDEDSKAETEEELHRWTSDTVSIEYKTINRYEQSWYTKIAPAVAKYARNPSRRVIFSHDYSVGIGDDAEVKKMWHVFESFFEFENWFYMILTKLRTPLSLYEVIPNHTEVSEFWDFDDWKESVSHELYFEWM